MVIIMRVAVHILGERTSNLRIIRALNSKIHPKLSRFVGGKGAYWERLFVIKTFLYTY